MEKSLEKVKKYHYDKNTMFQYMGMTAICNISAIFINLWKNDC